MPGDDHLEHAPIDLPVAELTGALLVHAEIGDVQPVAQVVEDEARFAAVVADRPGLPQRVDVAELDLPAPDAAGSGGEAVILGWRRRGEQGDVVVGGTHGSLVRGAEVGRHQPVPHCLSLPASASPGQPVIAADLLLAAVCHPAQHGADRYLDRL
ncbi:MAG: hypothetical protein J2P25_04145 [Nocardiopsaceae bacterium]|nr:hypothetical protein [Nocardiopsaceae bacterium]